MAVKKKKKVGGARAEAALEQYIALAREYATLHDIKKDAEKRLGVLAGEIRKYAKQAQLDKTKDIPMVDEHHKVETRFSTSEVYDVDRLHAWLRKKKLKTVIDKCFTEELVLKFDKAVFEKLDDAGKIPGVEDLESGDDPIYKVVDRTPSIYVHPVDDV